MPTLLLVAALCAQLPAPVRDTPAPDAAVADTHARTDDAPLTPDPALQPHDALALSALDVGLRVAPPAPVRETPGRRTARRSVMLLSGLTLGVAGGAVGGALPYWLGQRGSEDDVIPVLLTTGGIGAVLGTTLGVWGTGQLLGGEGRYTGTLAGFGVGLAGGALLAGGVAVLGSELNSDAVVMSGLVAGAALPVLGAVIGHELSAPVRGTSVTVAPALALASTGGSVGLQGTF